MYLLTHTNLIIQKIMFFHYKENLFKKLLKWDLENIVSFINFLSSKCENILFSSEFNNSEVNNFFMNYYNTYDFTNNKLNMINKKNVYFLKGN